MSTQKTIAGKRLSVYDASHVVMSGKKFVHSIMVTALCIIRYVH